MNARVFDAVAPAMWTIAAPAGASQQAVLRFGRHTIAVDDIATVRCAEVRHRPIAGLALGALLSIVLSVGLAAGVFEAGMRLRFLIGTVLLGGLGLFALAEFRLLRRQELFEVDIALKSGGSARFVSVDRDDVERLLARLAAHD